MYNRNILVEQTDPELWAAIQAENARQEHHIELIASENYASPAVMAAQGTQLTNKYAEGYPGRRYYGGCEHVDVAEQLAIDRVKAIFGAEAANVQPHCGASANEAVFLAFLKPGDTIMGMSLAEGGHLTHGMALNMSGKWFNVVSYGLNAKEEIDYDAMEKKAHETKPKLIIAGASAYSLHIDFARFAKVAKDVGAIFMVDMAHYAGLIAAGVYPNPVPHADVVTSTTHKTLRGPRGGVILMKSEHEKAINSAVFPGLQGGPLMHVIAAKAVAFKEAMTPEFKTYQQQVVKNAAIVAETLTQRGLRIVSGGTQSHVMLVDLRSKGITGKEAEAVLGAAHMTINKNAIPNDPEKPMVTSGVRVGTPAMTTRGFKDEEARLTPAPIARGNGSSGCPSLRRQAWSRSPQPPERHPSVAGGAHSEARPSRFHGCPRSGPGFHIPRRHAMKCPFCGHSETQVVETRISEDGDFIRRRRQCGACDKRFTTYERPDVNFPAIVKKDGRRIEYDRTKLLASMNLALRKRPVSTEQIDSAIERIEEKLLNLGLREVPSTRIGELVMRELKKLDKVAYVRFASVYRSFEDIDEFKTLVDEVRR